MDNNKVGKFIQLLRKNKNMTQKDLADKLFVTDKAISKWERGLSLPDITMLKSLAEILDVDVTEILNGEYGKKSDADIQRKVEEAIKKINTTSAKKKIKKEKICKVFKTIFITLFIITFLIQAFYLLVIVRKGSTYSYDIIFYIINALIIINLFLSLMLMKRILKFQKIIITIIATILFIINFLFLYSNGIQSISYLSFADNYSHGIVIKQNKKTGETTLYRSRLFIYALKKEVFSYAVNSKIKINWLTNDICSITYKDADNNIREYVATFGDRSDGSRYYYVKNAIYGEWLYSPQNGPETSLIADSKGITITENGVSELYNNNETKQFGVTALVLYKNNIPKYVIALNENNKIDKKTDIIQQGGTISLFKVSMNKTISKEMQSTVYKGNLAEGYEILGISANSYKIKNGILYISYNGKKNLEVPGDYTISDYFNDHNYQVSQTKTFFLNKKNNQTYLIYSDDAGKTWQQSILDSNSNITYQNIQFTSKEIGFMLIFSDAAMSTAYGEIKKTTDGGKTWTTINTGVGNDHIFKLSSDIKFFDENIGFLTMPINGLSSTLYLTKDGGKTFNIVKVPSVELPDTTLSFEEIYDYYNLPTLENKIITLEVDQGLDGDYHGNSSKKYTTTDNGSTWNLIK